MKNTGEVTGIEEQREQNRENFRKLSEAIGAYIISFENILAVMKHGIALLFHRHGMNNQSVIDVVIGDMTADPLSKLFDGMIAVTFINELKSTKISNKETNETIILLNQLYKKLADEISYRNKLAHTHWHLQHVIDTNTVKLTKLFLVANSKRIKKHKGAEDNFPDVDFTFSDKLIKRTKDNYDLARQLSEILINIKEKTPLKKKWYIE